MLRTGRWTVVRIMALAALLAAWKTSDAADETDQTSRDGIKMATDVTDGTSPLYQRRADLQQTLLATRRRYTAWLAEQPAVRALVRYEPWFSTRALPTEQIDAAVHPEKGVDPHVEETSGAPLWTRRDDMPEGHAASLLAGAKGTATYLTRTIHAPQTATLTVGVGGGEQLDLWLNGHKLVSARTSLPFDRYGCWDGYEGTRVDQVLVNLDLREGDNELVIRCLLGGEPSFFFSSAPDPVAGLWERVRDDFPADRNTLLEWIHADWFADSGWLTATDCARERALIARLAAECGDCGKSLLARLQQLESSPAEPSDARWLHLCVQSATLATLHRDVQRLRAAVTELGHSQSPEQYPADTLLDQLDDFWQRAARQAGEGLDPAHAVTASLMDELTAMRFEMLVERNPLLRDAEIIFVKRPTYNSKHYYDDFQHIRAWGGNLCVLSLNTGETRELVPQLSGGIFDRYDLSFDAERVVFGYRRPRREGFRIYEIGLDGQGLRQVTHAPPDEQQRIATYGQTSYGDSFYGLLGYQFWTDDVHPCYLPDGGICFASTRSEHGVLCTPAHYLACTNLFRLDENGMRPLSHGALSEFTPTMMEDGRVLYNRWEYVYKGIAAVQSLWTTRPDGSGGEELYGDNVANPGVFWQARQVPGHPHLVVCTGCGHEPLGVGQILLLDRNKNKRTRAPITNLTPDVKTENLRGIYHLRNGVWREDYYGPLYADPYPLSDSFFLVACNPHGRYNDPTAYGIHLLDVFGNRVPIYHDPDISCWQPMLLRARHRPPVLPSTSPASADSDAMATLFLSDIYRGLEGVERGTVKYLRVMEQVAKPWSAELDLNRDEDRSADGFGGHLAVSWDAHIWIAVLHGVVPVQEDGSASFRVPAGRNLYFQALDEDFMEVQRMRTFINLVAGESRSCIGCHEHRNQAPESRLPLALAQPPAELTAQPGEAAPRPLYYPDDVQPILDRHCVRCHDGADAASAPDLRGALTTLFNQSYESIMQGELVNTIREWNGGDYAMMHADAVPPYTYGSHRSRLVQLLREGHHDVALAREEFVALVTWIDCGAPYYGSYFGRRHLSYRDQPDFRPRPTLNSALGQAPPELDMPACDPLPAQLLAWWPLNGPPSGSAADASGGGHAARLHGTTESPGVDGQGACQFDGNAFVECQGLGQHPSVSLAMWVRPATLNHTWNPLLFTDDIRPGTLHFSLLADATPNVAIHTHGSQWTHRRARTSLDTDGWHHVALVCDARLGGRVRFYVDGQLSGTARLSLGLPLDLEGFRIGAWNQWEQAPANNFHGEIDEVRIYSGMLTDEQVAELAQHPSTPR